MTPDHDGAEGVAILEHVEESLKHYVSDPSLGASNALTPTYKASA